MKKVINDTSRKHMYYGIEGFQEWLKACENVEGGTMSPGGITQILGVSRQRVSQMVDEGKLESWIHTHESGKYGSYIAISIKDAEQMKDKIKKTA